MSQSSLESLDFRAAADSASDLIFVAENTPNTSGGPLICYANAAMLAQFGIAADSVVGQRADFWSGPRSDPNVLVRLRAAMIAMTAAEGELRCYRTDGSTFWSDWRGHGFFDHANNCMRWMAIGRNTDERRRAEDELVMLSTAIEHANDAVFVYAIRAGDAVPRIRYVNSAGLRYSGYTKEELQTAKHLGPNENSDMAEITTEMLAGRPMTKRMRLYRKDGSDYWANLSFQPIRDRLGTFSQWVCVERDISDIVEREVMRSDLMAMIGHDLRNPLQSILGFSELLLEDLAPQAAEYDAVRQIRISARRLESLAAEMLIVSLLEREEYRPQLEIVELGKLLEDVLSYFSERERIDLSAPVKIEIMVDSSGIRHVVENLLSNAVKFSTPASRVAVTVTSLEGAAVLSVRDSGIGIPAEDLPTIFERAKRGSNVGKRKGTGLGLSFAKHLVELNGGTIQVTSTEGLGTTFEVFFRPLTAA